jgi:hypothetical protein
MRPKWLLPLLLVSLAANLVELGLYARAEWQRRRERDRFFHWVQTSAPQWRKRVVVDSFEPRMRRLNDRLERWQAELGWQDWQQAPDSAMDRQVLDSITSLTRQQYELLYKSRRALPGVKDEKLRQRMEARWRIQMGLGN